LLLDDILKEHPLYIIDIGASGGLHPRWNKFPFEFKALLFEPDPREFERLKSQTSGKYIILNSVLSECAGEINFNLCKKQQISSVYVPNFSFLNKFPEVERFEIVKTLSIYTDTLDNQLNINSIIDIDFIKIDTQGHELPILKGAENALKNVVGIEVEVEFAPLYENQPLFPDVNEFIVKRGFELFDLRRHFWKRAGIKNHGPDRKGQLVFGDALYFRTPENICSTTGVTENKIIHAICVYLAYGYFEIASSLYDDAYNQKILSKDIYIKAALFLKRFRRKYFIPNFKGRGRIHNLMNKITNGLSPRIWHYGDRTLGM
jgi:FkbM family methyltransferase